MKKILSLLVVFALTSALIAQATEPQTLSSFLNKQASKVAEKENEINTKLNAQKSASEAKKIELQQKSVEQEKAINNFKEGAKARRDATNNAINAEKTYWKGVLNQK